MIKIKCLSGPWAGKVRTFQGRLCLETGEEVNPSILFKSFCQCGWQWQVDYAGITEEEILLWFRAELASRTFRALRAGRPVFFRGQRFKSPEEGGPKEVAGRLIETIVASGRMVTIDSDDEKGVVIGARGYEQ